MSVSIPDGAAKHQVISGSEWKNGQNNIELWSINHLLWASGGPHVPEMNERSVCRLILMSPRSHLKHSVLWDVSFQWASDLADPPLAGRFHGTHREGGFAVREQVWPGPASALLWGNTILYILTFRNIVHDVKVVERCLASTPPRYPGNRLTSVICLPPEAIKKHVGHNDAWGGGRLAHTFPSPPHPPSMHELTLVHM